MITGHAPTVAILCGPDDWTKGLAESLQQDIAVLRTDDHLGEPHMIRSDTRDELVAALAKLMQGRTAITSCATCRTALELAGVTVESVSAVTQHVPAFPRGEHATARQAHLWTQSYGAVVRVHP